MMMIGLRFGLKRVVVKTVTFYRSYSSTKSVWNASTNQKSRLEVLNGLSFRERMRRIPVDRGIVTRLEKAKLGRTKDKRSKGDRASMVKSTRDKLSEVFSVKPTCFASCATSDEFPDENRNKGEIAFAGRSNVGKSSLLNVLTGRSVIAKVSDKPGETQKISFYSMPKGFSNLVDMPGYGFSFANDERRKSWTDAMDSYIQHRESLKSVCVLVDSRHGMKPVDLEFCERLENFQRRFQVILTKGDLLDRKALAKMIWYTGEQIREFKYADTFVGALSSRSLGGVEMFRDQVFPAIRR